MSGRGGEKSPTQDGRPAENEPPWCRFPRYDTTDRIWVCCHGGTSCGGCHAWPNNCTPEPVADSDLGAAWAEVEAALAEGDFRTLVLSGARCTEGGCGMDYYAAVEGPNGEMWEPSRGLGCPTPAAALRALAARIEEALANYAAAERKHAEIAARPDPVVEGSRP